MATYAAAASLEEAKKKNDAKKQGMGVPPAKFGEGATLVDVQKGQVARDGGRGQMAQAHTPGQGIPLSSYPASMPEGPVATPISHVSGGFPGDPKPLPIGLDGLINSPTPAQQGDIVPPRESTGGVPPPPAAAGQGQGPGLYSPEVAPQANGSAGVPGAPVSLGEAPGVDRKTALNKGLMAAGLTMLDRGGRSYDAPVSAGSIMGQGGLVGMQAYDQDIQRQQVENRNQQSLEKSELDIAGAKQDLEDKPLETQRKKLVNEKLEAAIDAYRDDSKLNKILVQAKTDYANEKNPEQRKRIEEFIQAFSGTGEDKVNQPWVLGTYPVPNGTNELTGEPEYIDMPYAFNKITQESRPISYPGMTAPQGAPTKEKILDDSTAAKILREVGGDKEKAIARAQELGYTK